MKQIADIDSYIAEAPKNTQEKLSKLRNVIKEAAPDATETISYGLATFKLNGNLVHFGAFKTHIGFYPAPTGIEEFRKELEPYIAGKGTIQFPLDKPIPYDLVARIVAFRVQQNTSKKKK